MKTMQRFRAIQVMLILLICPCCSALSAELNLIRTQITDRLIRPWDMVFLNHEQALVTEKEGTLVKVNLTNGDKTYLTGMPKDLANRNKTGIGDNSGLFGIALHPNFTETSWVYLSYAASNESGLTTTKVVRGKIANNQFSDIETLFVAAPFSGDRYHYGGGLVFGRDNKLYFTVGERLFNEKDQPKDMPIAQNYMDRRGKIYRFNDDGSIPEDNPSFSSEVQPGIYAVGIRAAQGLTVHPKTGQIWFSEHGTRQGDEINVLHKGANYGWPIKTTGGYRFQEYQPPTLPERTFTPPTWFWQHTVAPTGLTFYTGSELTEWRGSLLVAGLSKGSFWRMQLEGNRIVDGEELFAEQRIRLRNVKQGPDGKLYVLTDEANGRILRIDKIRLTP